MFDVLLYGLLLVVLVVYLVVNSDFKLTKTLLYMILGLYVFCYVGGLYIFFSVEWLCFLVSIGIVVGWIVMLCLGMEYFELQSVWIVSFIVYYGLFFVDCDYVVLKEVGFLMLLVIFLLVSWWYKFYGDVYGIKLFGVSVILFFILFGIGYALLMFELLIF